MIPASNPLIFAVATDRIGGMFPVDGEADDHGLEREPTRPIAGDDGTSGHQKGEQGRDIPSDRGWKIRQQGRDQIVPIESHGTGSIVRGGCFLRLVCDAGRVAAKKRRHVRSRGGGPGQVVRRAFR